MAWTHAHKLENQRLYRIRTDNLATRKYEKTVAGFLMRTYRNMESRVSGVQWKKQHLYQNKKILPRAAYYLWSQNNREFHKLFDDWTASNYDRKLTPSINRIDSAGDYTLKNMEWITHSENSRLGAIARHSKERLAA